MVFNCKIFCKVQQQVVRWHGTTGKEVVAHPTTIKMITIIFVCKYMYKQLARWFKELMYLIEKIRIIFHMFEHFNCHYQIVVLYGIECTFCVIGNITLVLYLI